MNSRERLIAASRGGEVDQRPVLGWPGDVARSDAHVSSLANLAPNPEAIVLAEVANPFGLAMDRGLDLNGLLEADPHQGDTVLTALQNETRDQIEQAFAKGADGIFYCIRGAHPTHASPMQYGGYYLDRDREILSGIQDAGLNIVFVVGGEGTYVDFLSDLPAHVFAWDSRSSGISVEDVRAMRPGALAAEAGDADVLLQPGVDDITKFLENRALASV